MTEQEKREKAIKGLECCSTEDKRAAFCHEYDCPYRDYEECPMNLMRDVLALLKAQEPRVMTLEEVKARPDYAWIEKRNGKWVYITLFDHMAILNNLSSYAHTWNNYGKDELLALVLYNKDWRCWTSRPTDEERRLTPWET